MDGGNTRLGGQNPPPSPTWLCKRRWQKKAYRGASSPRYKFMGGRGGLATKKNKRVGKAVGVRLLDDLLMVGNGLVEHFMGMVEIAEYLDVSLESLNMRIQRGDLSEPDAVFSGKFQG